MPLCSAEGHVAVEALAVDGDIEAVVVAVAADEGEEVVASVAVDHHQPRGGVEGGGEGVAVVEPSGGGGVGAPVDGVDGQAVAVADDGYGAVGRSDAVVADGGSEVGAVVRGTYMAACGGDVVVSYFPAYDVGGHHAAVGVVAHGAQQLDHCLGALAEAHEDEGAAAVEVLEVVVEGAPHVGHGQWGPRG